MSNKKIILTIVILVLLVGNIFLGFEYLNVQSQLHQVQGLLTTQETNEKVVDFTKLFIDKVLKAKGEVSFDDRLKLENDVRDLHDQEILNQWNKFIDSQTESEAQTQVKNLLELLVNKIIVR